MRLIQAYLAGDRSAFDLLAARHQEMLYRVAYRMLGDHEEAQDAVQEMLVRLTRSLGQYKAEAKFSTWLYRLAVNTCIDIQRRRSKLQSAPMPADLEAPQSQADPDLHCERAFREHLLNQALKQVPEEQRLLLMLRDREGLTNQEVAEILGIGVGTLKARLHRARAALRRVLEEGVTVPGQEEQGRYRVAPSGILL